jgi:hypothetical protein
MKKNILQFSVLLLAGSIFSSFMLKTVKSEKVVIENKQT